MSISYATFVHLVAGGAAGTVGAIVTCPLEVLKTRLQSSNATSTLTNRTSNKSSSSIKFLQDKVTKSHLKSAADAATTRSKTVTLPGGLPIIDCFRSIIRNEGWRALFKGLGPNLVGVAPSRAIYFCTYSNVKGLLNSSFQASSESPLIHMTSAASAGFVSCTATNPIWFVKTRLQLSKDSVTVMQCIKSIYRDSGALGFYKGITASYMGISETIIHFVIYEFMKSQIQQRRLIAFSQQSNANTISSQKSTTTGELVDGSTKDQQSMVALRNAQSDNISYNEDDNDHNSSNNKSVVQEASQLDYYIFLQYMFASAFSKTIASSLAYPHEVARTRLREEGNRYQKFCQTVILVWREEGLFGLYRGLSIQLLRSIPFTAITMSTYELLVTIMSPV